MERANVLPKEDRLRFISSCINSKYHFISSGFETGQQVQWKSSKLSGIFSKATCLTFFFFQVKTRRHLFILPLTPQIFFYTLQSINMKCALNYFFNFQVGSSVFLCFSRYLIVAFVPWQPHACLAIWFINSLCVHVEVERSTDGGWHTSSGTSSDGQGGSLEQIARVWATQRQENFPLTIKTIYWNTMVKQ